MRGSSGTPARSCDHRRRMRMDDRLRPDAPAAPRRGWATRSAPSSRHLDRQHRRGRRSARRRGGERQGTFVRTAASDEDVVGASRAHMAEDVLREAGLGEDPARGGHLPAWAAGGFLCTADHSLGCRRLHPALAWPARRVSPAAASPSPPRGNLSRRSGPARTPRTARPCRIPRRAA